jgi:hypothetical protein
MNRPKLAGAIGYHLKKIMDPALNMGKSVPYNRHSTTDETQRAQRCLGVRIGKDYLNKKQTTKIIK